MNVAVFGLGYIGLTAACCIASEGHKVIGIDINESKVRDINRGIVPFSEPELEQLLRQALAEERLQALSVVGEQLGEIDLAVVCVGTPSGPDGAHNMSHISEVSQQIALNIGQSRSKPLSVVYRSTIKPGTIEGFIAPIFRSVLGEATEQLVELIYNPEFLRESSAVRDYFDPPKIVIGTRNALPSSVMDALYEDLPAPRFYVGYKEAELTKFIDNSWHATKVAFANEIGRVCGELQISAEKVHQIFKADTKLNISAYYTRPGGAFGGSCLPKDVRAFQRIAEDLGANTYLLNSLLASNESHKDYLFKRVTEGVTEGDRILLVGLAFKSGTDDLRESPNVNLALALLDAGYQLSIYDPCLEPARLKGQNLAYAYSFLPNLEALLVDKDCAESTQWDRVIASNDSVDALNLGSVTIVNTHTLP
jgi:GDP-mannose 6-dehydrogenase